jgi:hypothetical protein
MRVTRSVHEIEATSATARASDDGRFAVFAFVSSAPETAHYRMTLTRQQFDRLALQIIREQKRVPKPARPRSTSREST